MQLNLQGHPLHTRALRVVLSSGAPGVLRLFGSLIDVRKRGIVPVGSVLQGIGIIHHMEVQGLLHSSSLELLELSVMQPTVAFEASRATAGESCRDVVGRIAGLVGKRFDAQFNSELRQQFGAALGCSHLLTLLQLVAATAPWAIACAESFSTFQRDLVFDGSELGDGDLDIGVQLGDIWHGTGALPRLPFDLLERHEETRVAMRLHGWPAAIAEIAAAQRCRTRGLFADAPWCDQATAVAALHGLTLGKGTATTLSQLLSSTPPLRDALMMLGPTLIQCRAAFPDKWLNAAAATPHHPGLIGLADSCYMWRRGGGLQRVRDALIDAAKPK